VVERGCGFWLLGTTVSSLFIADRFGRQHLDRNFAIKPDVLSQEHSPIPPAPSLFDNAVVRNLLVESNKLPRAIVEHIEH